ncbi:ECF-type sigma factor [Undibacterium sp.]|uniref:ECF-type sigma factor n=1 Tax=Undibacterium sp. TaxID=1914977 RepID=UPI00374CEA9B
MHTDFEALYGDLRRLARAQLSRNKTITSLNATSLVHESYLRLLNAGQLRTEERGEFMAYMAQVMRSVIVDFVRARSAEKRGGNNEHVRLDTDMSEKLPAPEAEILHVHEALQVLSASDPRLGSVVEMHYFGGMSEAEIAGVLGVSDRTVRRDWEKARLLLAVALR